uniref:Uncharacterized protein n=1 Tax=Psilocybe cubensis TaxID=181762 RepID=A0A8H8CIN7_PSICU
MPKHIAREEYQDTQEVAYKTFIHPDIELHGQRSDSTHYLLTSVFSMDKGGQLAYKYPGPGVIYFTEGRYTLSRSYTACVVY